MSPGRAIWCVVAILTLLICVQPGAETTDPGVFRPAASRIAAPACDRVLEGEYIVVLRDSTPLSRPTARVGEPGLSVPFLPAESGFRLEDFPGVAPFFEYRHSFTGRAVRMDAETAREVAARPEVLRVVPRCAEDLTMREEVIRKVYDRVLRYTTGSDLRLEIRDFRHVSEESLASVPWADLVTTEPGPVLDLARKHQHRDELGFVSARFLPRWMEQSSNYLAVVQEELGDVSIQDALWAARALGDDFGEAVAVTSVGLRVELEGKVRTYRALFGWLDPQEAALLRFQTADPVLRGLGLVAAEPSPPLLWDSELQIPVQGVGGGFSEEGELRSAAGRIIGADCDVDTEFVGPVPFGEDRGNQDHIAEGGTFQGVHIAEFKPRIGCHCTADCQMIAFFDGPRSTTTCTDTADATAESTESGLLHLTGQSVATEPDALQAGESAALKLGFACVIWRCEPGLISQCLNSFSVGASFKEGSGEFSMDINPDQSEFWKRGFDNRLGCTNQCQSVGGGDGGGGGCDNTTCARDCNAQHGDACNCTPTRRGNLVCAGGSCDAFGNCNCNCTCECREPVREF